MEKGDVPALRFPLDADLVRLGVKLDVEIVVEGVPVLPPPVERLVAVDEHLRITGRVESEAVEPSARGCYFGGPGDLQARNVVATVGRSSAGRPVFTVLQILKVDHWLLPGRDDLPIDRVSGRPAARAIWAGDVQSIARAARERVGAGIAKARD